MGKVEREMIKQLNLECRDRQTGKTTELINKAIIGVKSGEYDKVLLMCHSKEYLNDLKHRIKYETGVEKAKIIDYGYNVNGIDIVSGLPLEYFYGKSGKWLILIDEPDLIEFKHRGSQYLSRIIGILNSRNDMEVTVQGLGSRV